MKSTTSPTRFTLNLLAVACCALLSIGCSNMNTKSANAATNDEVKNETASQTNDTEHSASVTTGENDTTLVSTLTQNLSKSGIEAKIISAVPTHISGLYWVRAEGIPPFFTDKAGKHVIQGQVVAIGGDKPIDITAQLAGQVNKEKLAAVDKNDMIIFPAKGETKGIIYAFTDSTCPYCKKLHEDVSDINAKGIEVRYLAWPRNQAAIPTMEAVWCSEDKAKAMNISKTGGKVEAPSCDSPVQKQMELGMSLGVQGTPAIFTESGEQIGGYLPPEQIAQALGL